MFSIRLADRRILKDAPRKTKDEIHSNLSSVTINMKLLRHTKSLLRKRCAPPNGLEATRAIPTN